MVTHQSKWVFLTYRLPREPSAPRLALWRALRRLGALLVSDGLVALPHSARNLEHLEWLAAEIREGDGSASVWLAQPTTARSQSEYAESMQRAVDEEYQSVVVAARQTPGGDGAERRRTLRRLRAQLRRIRSRDYFGAPSGESARDEVERLARSGDRVRA